MNENILKFYLEAIKLKEVIRTGWKEVGVSDEKIENVADHVFGCMALTFGITSEKDITDLDLIKVFKMIFAKELIKSVSMEQSITSKEDNQAAKRNALVELTDGLAIQSELVSLYDEAIELSSKEAKFALYVSKLESDIQAKKYELEGEFTLENALADIENYPEDIKAEIKGQVKNASDGWILFDRRYYDNDETFVSLSKDIQKLN